MSDQIHVKVDTPDNISNEFNHLKMTSIGTSLHNQNDYYYGINQIELT